MLLDKLVRLLVEQGEVMQLVMQVQATNEADHVTTEIPSANHSRIAS